MPQKKEVIIATVCACTSLSFTVCFFVPLDLYLHNAINYQIGLMPEIIALVPVTILFAALLSVVLLIPKWRTFARDVILLLVWGISLSMYAQVLFMNGEMVFMTGDGEDYTMYATYTTWHIANFLLYVIITVFPLCVWKQADDKGRRLHFEKPLIYATIVITGMQITGLVAARVSNPLSAGFENTPKYLSYDNIVHPGTEQNVDIFILDRLDNEYVDCVLQDNPSLYEALDGFTCYRNNISEYPGTFPSITSTLTGCHYGNMQFKEEYWNEAWSRHNFIDAFRENNYNIGLCLELSTTFGDFGNIINRADNIENIENFRLRYNHIIGTNLKLSLFRSLPYLLKDNIGNHIAPGFNNDFIYANYTDGQLLGVSAESDLMFFRYLNDVGLSIGEHPRTLNVIHLNCTHNGGYRYDSDTGAIIPDDTTAQVTGIACFKVIVQYIESLKALGVYDNTAIIIMGDHSRPMETEYDESGTYLSRVRTTGLLIKPDNAKGTLQMNFDTPLSHRYLQASALELAGIDHKEFGESYWDIQANPNPPKRLYYTMWGTNAYDGSHLVNYEISGDANDLSNWKKVLSP